MATVTACPEIKIKEWDANGNPASGYKLYAYATGASTTPQDTYIESTGTTPNANPVILDSRGEAIIYLDVTKIYRFVLKTDTDTTVWTRDGVEASLSYSNIFQYASTIVATVTALKALTGMANNAVASTTGYTTASDGGHGVYRYNSASAATDNGCTVIAPNSGSGRWLLLHDGEIDVRQAGCYCDGSTDDSTQAGVAFNLGIKVSINSGTLVIDDINVTTAGAHITLASGATIKLKTPGGAVTDVGITFTANNCTLIAHGTIDGDSKGRSLVSVVGSKCTVMIYNSKNVTAPAAATAYVSGIEVTGDDCIAFIRGTAYSNTGQANGSVPRLITVQGTANNTKVLGIYGTTINSGITIGSSTGYTHISEVDVRAVVDNGVYHLGGKVEIGSVTYYGEEEAVVTEVGELNVEEIRTIGRATSALALQDSGDVYIGHIVMSLGAANADSAQAILRTRSGNTASGRVTINEVSGVMAGATFGNLSTGTVQEFNMSNVNVEFRYDAAIMTSFANFHTIVGVKQFNLVNWRVKIIDLNNVLTASDVFLTTAPTTNLINPSYFSRVAFTLTDANGTTLSDGLWRGVNFANTLIYTDGVLWKDLNPNMYIQSPNTSGADGIPLNSIVGIVPPTCGAFRLGEELVTASATAYAAKYRNISAGSPGTWLATSFLVKKDTTGNRPTLGTYDVGAPYLDTTIDADGKAIWWTGTAWVDATGATV